MRLKTLIKNLSNLKADCAFDDFEVRGITCNSKEVLDNFVFVAVKGNKQDGNEFIDEAIARGAKAIIGHRTQDTRHKLGSAQFINVKDTRKVLAELAAEFYKHPSQKIKVVGVTGTNGKTTITYLIEALLKRAGYTPAVIGTINYRFKGKVTPAKNTTPGPIELQSLLAEMLMAGVDYAVTEVSSHALDQERVSGIRFHAAIFTNLTHDHLDYHQTFRRYFQAKAKLFKSLDKRAYAIINIDDAYGRKLRDALGAKIITYGIERPADIIAEKIKYGINHSEFVLKAPQVSINLKTLLIGRHNIYNLLAAASFALKENLDPEFIQSAVNDFSGTPGRLERVKSQCGISIFIDYAHTPDALKNVLNALRPLVQKKIFVVFGCGGERDSGKRPKMGNIASELANFCIITNDNPRSEDPQKIILDIKRGIKKNNYSVIPDRKEAIKKCLSLARKGDLVLIAGKGHENYQILKDKTVPFDDVNIVKECLQLKNY